MLKKCVVLLYSVFMLVNCAHHPKVAVTPLPTAPQQKTKLYRSTPAFEQINVQGQINVDLHTGYRKPQVLLTGDTRDIAQLTVTVVNDTLYINLPKGYPQFGAVKAEIRGQILNGFRYQGAGMITGNNINTRFLNLYLANAGTTRLAGSVGLQRLTVVGNGLVQINGAKSYDLKVVLQGNPKVQLNGWVTMSQLDIDGNAWFSLYWVKSDNLTIRAKKDAKIQLAGAVNRLDVELWNGAQFKGRYLRAQRSFTKTHDKAIAEISAVNHQSDLATGLSDIYYYNIANTRADFMASKGSILDMKPWSQYDTQHMTRYNKQFP